MTAPVGQGRPSDLLERDFTAGAPNRRRVADITMPGRRVALPKSRLFSISLPGWCRLAGSRIRCRPSWPSMPWKWRSRDNREGPCHRVTEVTTATMEWAARFNNERPHSTCGNILPKEFGENYYRPQVAPAS